MYCRRCGARLQQGMVICPDCGARRRRQTTAVRCAHCGGRVSLELTVCPHCGRNVRPAGPRWGIWILVAGLTVLAALWGLGRLPLDRIGREVERVRASVTGLVEILGPVPSPQAAAQVVATRTAAPRVTITPAREPVEFAEVEGIEAGVTGEAIVDPGAEPTPEASPVATAPETGTVTATAEPPSPTPTATPTETPTSTSTATATALPPTPLPPGAGSTYIIRSGDSLYSIGQRFGVTVDALRAANGMTGSTRLQVGQKLIIPGVGAPAAATATSQPRATATPTSAPTPEPAQVQLAAPELRSPAKAATYSGSRELLMLEWGRVDGMPSSGQYQVGLRWLAGGQPQEHVLRTTATEIRVPTWLWQQADQPAREYQWFVQAVELGTDGRGGERVIPLGPPSETRNFYWN